MPSDRAFEIAETIDEKAKNGEEYVESFTVKILGNRYTVVVDGFEEEWGWDFIPFLSGTSVVAEIEVLADEEVVFPATRLGTEVLNRDPKSIRGVLLEAHRNYVEG